MKRLVLSSVLLTQTSCSNRAMAHPTRSRGVFSLLDETGYSAMLAREIEPTTASRVARSLS